MKLLFHLSGRAKKPPAAEKLKVGNAAGGRRGTRRQSYMLFIGDRLDGDTCISKLAFISYQVFL